MMAAMSNQQIVPVDFNNREEDGAVRLTTRGTLLYFEQNCINVKINQRITMSDGELVAEGIIRIRDNMYIAEITAWLDDQ